MSFNSYSHRNSSDLFRNTVFGGTLASTELGKVTKAVIPAAGMGTRFLPATKALPKEMLPLIDKPVIQFVVEEIVGAGLEDILIVTGRNKNALENHFDRAVELEQSLNDRAADKKLKAVFKSTNLANIHYVRQKDPLGLGHATLRAKSFIGNSPFALLLGDEIISGEQNLLSDMIKIAEEKGVSVVALMEVPDRDVEKYGIAALAGNEKGPIVGLTGLVEKPRHRAAPSNLAVIGRYVLQPEIFEVLEQTKPSLFGEIQLTDALNQIAQMSSDFPKILGLVFDGKRFDTGDKLSYMKASVELALEHSEIGNEFKKWLSMFSQN